jgi:hypothetical protein
MPEEPKGSGPLNPVVIGVICALLGAFGGCTAQFSHDINGRYGGPNYLLAGLAIGLVVGLIVAAAFRERNG